MSISLDHHNSLIQRRTPTEQHFSSLISTTSCLEHVKELISLAEAPLLSYFSMAKPKPTAKSIKEIHQNQNQRPKRSEKPASWSVVRGLFNCKDQQRQQQQQQKQPQQEKQEQQQKKKHQEQALEETSSKKCKKMKCSGSLCSNTKVMQRPETASPDVQKKRVSMGLTTGNDNSSRSIKAPLNEINGVPSSTNSSLCVSSNSSINNGGSFRGMPFRRLSGCYECRMVVDPVLGFTRDPSLRSSICSCPECGEIFAKAENLEVHQAVRHAGKFLSDFRSIL